MSPSLAQDRAGNKCPVPFLRSTHRAASREKVPDTYFSLIAQWAGLAIATAIVVMVAVAVRVSSISESLWVDELHSAWAVWGSLDEVVPRSQAGNQSPVYFVGLWCWKQIFGGSEFALRITSVIAVAGGCGVLCWGVGRWTNCIAAGVASGMTLALESNSLFFGTELRPFAVVLFFSSLAAICFVRLAMSGSREGYWTEWTTLILSILLAMACQPTSLGVLIWLPLVLCIVWTWVDRRTLADFESRGVVLGIIAVASAWAIWQLTLDQSWEHRNRWASFASASHIGQLWEAWPWLWLLAAPGVTLVAAKAFHRVRDVRADAKSLQRDRLTVTIGLIVVGSTFAYWWVAWSGWLPLWHRRYFVAGLPLLAVAVGGATASASRLGRAVPWAVGVAILVGLTVHQGTFGRLVRTPMSPQVVRGENWRSAIQWAEVHSGQGETVYLDGGLIEANSMPMDHLGYHQKQYLRYPVSGIYSLSRPVQPIGSDLKKIAKRISVPVTIITRRGTHQIDKSLFPDAQIRGFGGVSVVRLPDRR